MSSTLEDRLTAALHARADLVQPEDLRESAPPAPFRLRRSTALLAAASVVIAGTIAAVWLTNDEGKPEPAKPMPDGYVEVDRLTGDVDGDGRDDLVRLGRLRDEVRLPSAPLLVADLATDRRTAVKLDAGPVPALVGLADVGVPGHGIVTKRPRPDGFELSVHAMETGRLAKVEAARSEANLLRSEGDPGDLAYTTADGLRTWAINGRDPAALQRPYLLVWAVVNGRLTRTVIKDQCWQIGEPEPTACPHLAGVPSDGDYVPGLRLDADLDGDGRADKIRVSWPRSENNAKSSAVIVASLSSGDRTGRYLPGGSLPGTLRSARLPGAAGDVPVVVVETDFPGGMPYDIFRVLDGRLTPLTVAAGAPVDPSSSVSTARRQSNAFTDGRLMSWRLRLPDNEGAVKTVEVYDYRVADARLVPVRRAGSWCVSTAYGTDLPRAC